METGRPGAAAVVAPELAQASGTRPMNPADRPWVGQYAAGTPATIVYPDQTLAELFAESAARFADRPALIYFGRAMAYRELARLVARFANRLRQLGVSPGDRVLLLLPNIPQFVIAHFGTLAAGGIAVPLSPLLVEREIERLAQEAGARVVVVLDRSYPSVVPLLARGLLARVIVATPDEYLPLHLRLLYPLKAGAAPPASVPDDPRRGVYRFRRLLAGADECPPQVAHNPDDVAALLATGGTTDLPKLVALTHRNLVANAVQVRHWIPQLRPGVEVNLSALPYTHALGLTAGLHVAVLLGGAQVLVPRPTMGEVVAALRSYRPTIFPGVPLFFAGLCAAAREDARVARSLAALRHCVSGAAALPAPVRREFTRLTGGQLVEGYGLTEAAPIVMAGPFDGRARDGSIGLPFPDTEVRLVDPATGADVPSGARGELLVRGPQVMKGYWRRPEATAKVLRDGWLRTGDIATMDEDGYFSIVDRQKDVIITGGENIYPHEIEEILYAHPKIQDAAVVGVPHTLAGQVAKAYIVPRAGETLTRREVLTYCAARLAKFKVPRRIEFRQSLPKTPLGKVLRCALAEEAARAG